MAPIIPTSYRLLLSGAEVRGYYVLTLRLPICQTPAFSRVPTIFSRKIACFFAYPHDIVVNSWSGEHAGTIYVRQINLRTDNAAVVSRT